MPLAAVPLVTGSTAEELVLGAGAIAGFQPEDLVACDVDYAQQVGYVGTGIAAAHVKNPADVRQDANYVRRVRSEEHTSELQSHLNLVCRLLLEKKKKHKIVPLRATG